MRNYGIVTVYPVVAAILVVYLGVFVPGVTSRTVVLGKRSIPQQVLEAEQDLPGERDPLHLFTPEDLLGEEDDDNMPPSGSALAHFLQRLQQSATAANSSRGSRREQQRLLNILRQLRMRLRPSSGEYEKDNLVEGGMGAELRRTWSKRLELLENDGNNMADPGVLEARRRMGPEFNPTGW